MSQAGRNGGASRLSGVSFGLNTNYASNANFSSRKKLPAAQ